ncbi:disease resistance protein RPV1-like isoform X1 [Arachis stenosperma]|uniref:disease resistance protein RPV1-like isoform X1 n=2 Tax=Arachis stenosperma TaxID=217475 RepID=UPI0025AD0A70|nr:disease resistance protein RPV1-like isoform X1 [Arachis stenosperma]
MASSSFNVPLIKHDLFISFRGEIRTSFLCHLIKRLRDDGIISFFVDEENLGAGDEISSALLQAIEESSISLVIFSKDYASSRWCMEELVKIIECKEQYQRTLVPVFYNVDPSHVRHQKRTFEEAFDVHTEKYRENMAKVQNWRSALRKAADLSGIHYPSTLIRNEVELIEKIIKVVNEKLPPICPNKSKGAVGIDEQVKSIESLLAKMEPNDVGILGIWGMGGIGKTTIAQVIFNKYSSQYEGCCFLKNVREESERHGLDYLYEQLFSQLLKKQNLLVKGPANAISAIYERRLSQKEVLIVLDDVDTSDILDYLTGEQTCLAPASRVIVTTRDKQILIAARAHGIYEVKRLSFKSSLELFCIKAFNKIYPENGYEKLSQMAVNYANGIPLALKVLGSFLCSKSAVVWKNALKKLQSCPDKRIFNVLKLSYDGLDDSDKSIFLDIACFFKGECKDNVIRFLDSCSFYADVGIDNLESKALITISYNRIQMHDLIQQMGWEVVRQESNKDPTELTRINKPEDFHNLLKNSKGKNLVEGIMIDLSQIGDLHLDADTFKNMPQLRFLKFYAPRDEKQLNVYIPIPLESFSARLKYLEWNSYPLNSLSSMFCVEQLVELRMPNSQISKLWDGTQELPNLIVLYLYGCKKLVELPDFSKATKLKTIDLWNCEKLCQLHPSILSIQTLEELYLTGCTKLKCVKSNLKSVKTFYAYNCLSLEKFSVSSEKLSDLDISLWRIKSLPNEICSFFSLEYLCLSNCRKLIDLPRNIKAQSRLRALDVSGCSSLRSIPELPPSIEELYAVDCTSLETIFNLKAVFSLNRRKISFANCVRLEQESVNDIMEDAHLTIFRNVLLLSADPDQVINYYYYHKMLGCVCYPGYKVPKWFGCETRGASIIIELHQPYYELLGFFFCCVISQNLPPYYFEELDLVNIKCEYRYFGDGVKDTFVSKNLNFVSKRRCCCDHVLIWTDPFGSENILSEIERCRLRGGSDDDDSTCNQKMSFRFSIDRPKKGKRVQIRRENDEDCFIKECGVIPMYASTLLDAIQNLELEFNLKPHHNPIPGINLDEVKSMMIRKSKGKSKLH